MGFIRIHVILGLQRFQVACGAQRPWGLALLCLERQTLEGESRNEHESRDHYRYLEYRCHQLSIFQPFLSNTFQLNQSEPLLSG